MATKKRPAALSAAELRRRHYSLPEKIAMLHRFVSYREMGRQFGVHERTVRRWAKSEAVPMSQVVLKRPLSRREIEISQRSARAVGMVASGFEEVKKEFTREASQRRTGAMARPVRVKRIDPFDLKRERKIPSDSVDIHVLRSNESAIVRVLKRYRDRANLRGVPGIMRFFVLSNEGAADYPGQYYWTEPEELSSLEDDEIEEFVSDIFERGAPVIWRVQDR